MPYTGQERRDYQRKWWAANKDKANAKRRQRRKDTRIKVFELLGGRCVNCGCDDYDALEINHINGGGRKEYKTLTQRGARWTFYNAILKGTRTRDDLEITCRVCNAHHYLVKLKGVEDKWTITYGDNQYI